MRSLIKQYSAVVLEKRLPNVGNGTILGACECTVQLWMRCVIKYSENTR